MNGLHLLVPPRVLSACIHLRARLFRLELLFRGIGLERGINSGLVCEGLLRTSRDRVIDRTDIIFRLAIKMQLRINLSNGVRHDLTITLTIRLVLAAKDFAGREQKANTRTNSRIKPLGVGKFGNFRLKGITTRLETIALPL